MHYEERQQDGHLCRNRTNSWKFAAGGQSYGQSRCPRVICQTPLGPSRATRQTAGFGVEQMGGDSRQE